MGQTLLIALISAAVVGAGGLALRDPPLARFFSTVMGLLAAAVALFSFGFWLGTQSVAGEGSKALDTAQLAFLVFAAACFIWALSWLRRK